MCLETMDVKQVNIGFRSETERRRRDFGWRLFRAMKTSRAALRRYQASATIRRPLRPDHQPTGSEPTGSEPAAKRPRVLGDVNQLDTAEPWERNPAAALDPRQPAREMAPGNTTQYLMNRVYEDMRRDNTQTAVSYGGNAHVYSESLSPSGVYAALDSACDDNCLAFQQRDFEEAFGLYAKPE